VKDPPAEEAARTIEQLALAEALAPGPEPERSLRLAEGVLEAAAAADAEGLAARVRERPQTLVQVLRALCGAAPFLASHLRARPERLRALVDDPALAEPRTRSGLDARLAEALRTAPPDEVAAVLRRFKYDELARITVREADPALVPVERVGETLAELSRLAESLLDAALASATRELGARLGPPVWTDARGERRPLRFCVLGLGKLGGEELNYASDVDLIYLMETPPVGSEPLREGPEDLAPLEYFSRLAVRFGRLVEEVTPEGFIQRIDLDLRPEGGQGALVTSSQGLADYYDGWAATWEKAAFMKARPVAGDIAFGWRVVRSVDPMIYQSSVDLQAVDAIRDMKARVEEAHVGDPERFHVKLGAGGIRDVEFVAQAHQLLQGGRIPQVRGRSAPGALRALVDVGVLPADAGAELLAAYHFLRRLENRLQMEGERQTHQLPPAGPARERLARTLFPGDEAVARLEGELAGHTGRVRAHFDALFRESGHERIVDLFARAAPRLLAVSENRRLLEGLAHRFASEIESATDPERALANLERFAEGLGGSTFYYLLLADRPELIPRLVALFASSRTLSAIVTSLPELIEPLFDDPHHLLGTQETLRESLALLRHSEGEKRGLEGEELDLVALRLFQQRELVNIGLLDLADEVSARQVEDALTDLAEVCLEDALRIAHAQLARSPKAAAWVEEGEFLVVGMGKLGSRELSYGSDLDVIFLYDLPDAEPVRLMEAQEAFVRVAQKVAWALQTRTAQGVCYEVDARLRPSGNQGMLVTSLPSFERYHRGETGSDVAAIWERQALLRARPVVGSKGLGERFEALRRSFLSAPLPEGAAAEIERIRRRMEQELAQETDQHRNLKTGRGGLLDVESACQWLQLAHGGAHPELFEPRPIEATLERLQALGLLPEQDAQALAEGWRFLQRLGSRLRVVENRSIADLEHDRSDLDSVARALGYATSERSGTARLPLLEAYARQTEAIRAVYERVLAAGRDIR
jgi:glutamate-ammonia-ligase adenylyltransferase